MTAVHLPQNILDPDSHEMAPTHLWGDLFGEAAARIADLALPVLKKAGGQNFVDPSISADEGPIDDDSIWNIRGTRAPGAFDMARRLQVMDRMGVEKQLLFPSYALFANHFLSGDMRALKQRYGFEVPEAEIRSLGRRGLDGYNTWAEKMGALNRDRIRPVGYLRAADSVQELTERTKDLLDRGIRAIWIPSTIPPGGRSPAHPDLDPFWSLLVERSAVFTMHVGDLSGFTASAEWVKAPAFALGKIESHEIGLEPYSFSTLSFAISNYLTCMVLGGVFERHPQLRVGAIELGASWLPPLARNLDMWATKVYATRLKPFISRLPSEYLASNVRVTPWNGIEPIGDLMKNNPDLSSCFCYSTDYPHVEGGLASKQRMFDEVSHLGQKTVDKLFHDNAAFLFPN
jgi:predicted TIM-barrel fold metal-dependent hydrolase